MSEPDPGRAKSIGAALALAEERLTAAGVDSPQADAMLLLGHVLGRTRTELLVTRDEPLPAEHWEEFLVLMARRETREPLQLVIGEATFLDLTLALEPGVLVPRPETERLVELALVELAGAEPDGVVIDVGTGTGAIALAVKAARPELEVWATDVSSAALDLAGRNADRLGLQVELRRSDLLSDAEVAAAAGRAVAVISNPPYLPDSDKWVVSPEVAVEPDESLFAGVGGLDVARRLVQQLMNALKEGALVALELDPRNADELAREMAEAGWSEVRLEPDLAGRERFVLARRREVRSS